MYIGYMHAPKNLIPEADIVQHMLDFTLDFSKSDDELRHAIMYTRHRDQYIYSNSIDLATVLHQCKSYNIIPIIALNFFWAYRKDGWVQRIPPAQFARCARLTAQLIIATGLPKAYLSILNEPKKWLTNELTGHYSQASLDALSIEQLNKIKIIVGNDEFFLSLYNYLGSLFKDNSSILLGYHALSSMGINSKEPLKYFYRIGIMADLARRYGLKIIGNECGSWFKNYRTKEGHDINEKIIMECKKCGYVGCNIVLPDINEKMNKDKYKQLGYRIWSDDYKTLNIKKSNINYYNDFIKIIKQEGGEPMPPQDRLIYYKVPHMEGEDVKAIEKKLRVLGFDLPTDGEFDYNDRTSIRVFQELTKITKDGIIGSQTRKTLKNTTVEKFYPEVFQSIWNKKDYSIEVIDYFLSEYGHPNIHGTGKWFKQAEQETGFPVEWMLASAKQESGERNSEGVVLIGQSYYGREWKNLFGWAIYDSGPQPKGKFETYKDCILTVPREIKRLYLDSGAPHNNGGHIFGIEIKYSTAGHNAIRKAKNYREICVFMDKGIMHKMPEYVEDLVPILDKYFIRKEE